MTADCNPFGASRATFRFGKSETNQAFAMKNNSQNSPFKSIEELQRVKAKGNKHSQFILCLVLIFPFQRGKGRPSAGDVLGRERGGGGRCAVAKHPSTKEQHRVTGFQFLRGSSTLAAAL